MTSTHGLFHALRQQTQKLQSQLTQAQQELASGRIADPSRRIGAAFGQMQALRGETAVTEAYLDANRLGAARLDAVGDALDRLHGLATALQTAALGGSSASPSLITAQSQAARSDMLAVLNTVSGGVHLFGGENSAEPPWSADAAERAGQTARQAFVSHFGFPPGDAAAHSISADDMRAFLAGPLNDAFENATPADLGLRASARPRMVLAEPGVPVSGGPSAADAPLRALVAGAGLFADLAFDTLSEGAAAAVRDASAQMTGAGISGLIALQTQAGRTQARLTDSRQALERAGDRLASRIADSERIDPFETQTRLSALMVQLEMSYQMTARIARLSLGNYL